MFEPRTSHTIDAAFAKAHAERAAVLRGGLRWLFGPGAAPAPLPRGRRYV